MTKRTERPSAAVRIRVMKRDRFQCTYCGTPGTDAELEIDHIVPVAAGGSNHMSNLTTACRRCNQIKGSGDAPQFTAEGSVRAESRGVVGMFVHTLLDGGRFEHQGVVVGLESGNALVQVFSWFDGEPWKVIAVPMSDLLDANRCSLYRDRRQWIRAHLATMASDGTLGGTVEQKIRLPFTSCEIS